MESFIVRIYRRAEVKTRAESQLGTQAGTHAGTQDGAAETVGPVGTVEATATGARTAFHSHQELLSALGSDTKRASKPARKSVRQSAGKTARSGRTAATQLAAPAKK